MSQAARLLVGIQSGWKSAAKIADININGMREAGAGDRKTCATEVKGVPQLENGESREHHGKKNPAAGLQGLQTRGGTMHSRIRPSHGREEEDAQHTEGGQQNDLAGVTTRHHTA